MRERKKGDRKMKMNVKVIYLDHEGFIKFEKERHERNKRPFNQEWAERMWSKAYKHKRDGVDYYTVECHPDFFNKALWSIAEKYGFPVIEELEWFNL